MAPMNLQDNQNASTRSFLNPFTSEFRPFALVQLILIPLLFTGVLYRAQNSPEWFGSFHLDLLFLYVTPLLLLAHTYYRTDSGLWIHVAQASLLILLTFILLRQHNLYIPGDGRTLHVVLVFLLYAVYPFIGYDIVAFLRSRAVYVAAYVLMLGVFFFHVNSMAAGSTKASFVVYMALLFGVNVFFIPRYVSRNVFFWGLSLVAGFFVVIGLPVYVIGSYDLWWFQPQLFEATATIPLLGTEFHYLQSVLDNPNILAVLTFSGAFAALVLAVENVFQRRFLLVSLASVLFFLNGLATYLTHARASWLALALATVVYAGYVLFGRRSVPFTVVPLALASAVLLLTILFAVGPIDAHGRAPLWMAGLRAIKNAPSALGYGVVNTHAVIEPFVTDPHFRGYSPHNSYVQIFLQVGIVGGLAYLVIVLGSIVEGIVRWDSVDVPMLGFALAFAVHQTFAVYTMFNNAVASILAMLVFGYLICGYER